MSASCMTLALKPAAAVSLDALATKLSLLTLRALDHWATPIEVIHVLELPEECVPVVKMALDSLERRALIKELRGRFQVTSRGRAVLAALN